MTEQPHPGPARAIGYPGEFCEVAGKLVSQALREVRIYSPLLPTEVYGKQAFVDAVSDMVRANRRSKLQVLVSEKAELSSRAHRLIELAKHLPSLCQIRVLKEEPDRFKEDYLLADREGLLMLKAQHDDEAWLDPYAPAEVASRIEHFDYLWQRAVSDPEFRKLSI